MNRSKILIMENWNVSLPKSMILPKVGPTSWTGFDPEFTRDNLLADVHVTARTAHLILAMSQADKALAPTHWQASTFPAHLQEKISVIHDGVDCAALTPDWLHAAVSTSAA
mgnify:CR=1 FL=1